MNHESRLVCSFARLRLSMSLSIGLITSDEVLVLIPVSSRSILEWKFVNIFD